MKTFISDLPNYHHIQQKQLENATRLMGISKKFLKNAKINQEDISISSERTIILESGHQPNFHPHAGTWKKAFLLADIQKKLMVDGNNSLAFFGFPDRNISTARLLSRNQIPALNKKGVEAIGFRISETDRLKPFCNVQKPSPELWQKEMENIERFYSEIFNKFPDKNIVSKTQLNQILEIMWNSYDLADNFAELNAFIFAKICHEILDINLWFFLYSDIQKQRLFIDESKKICQNVNAFNKIYNRVIKEKGLDISPVVDSHVPFWYQCECGGKINIFLKDSGSCEGICPVCKKEHHLLFDDGFENLKKYYDKMDFNAVSRNIVMAESLGDTIFLSGMGGSLQYGAIADQISQELKFHYPITLAWQSKDYYLGMTKALAIQELTKIFSVPFRGLFDPELNKNISQCINMVVKKCHDAQNAKEDYRSINLIVGMRNQSKNWPIITKNVFSNNPSFFDILVNQNFSLITNQWAGSLNDADISNCGWYYKLKANVTYTDDLIEDIKTEEIPQLFQIIQGLEVNG